jgi:hypothetical protein
MAAAVLTFSITYRNTIPFGPGQDPFDYITTARRLAHSGSVRFPLRPLEELDLHPRYAPFFVPEPYVLSPDATHYVPLYPLGTATLMAVLVWLAGDNGPYFLAPILGAACVAVFYLLARRWFHRREAFVAALLLAASPIFLGPARAPLSDIPALFFLLVSLACLLRGDKRTALVIGGLACGLATLIRPNLLVGVPVLAWLAAGGGEGGQRWRRAAIFGGGVAPLLALQAALNAFLYGSPLATGYSRLPDFFQPFSWTCVGPALLRRLEGLWWGAGPLALAAAVWALARLRDRLTVAAGLWVAAIVGFYSFYCVLGTPRLDRFMLPCLPVVFLLAVATARSLPRRRLRSAGLVVLALAAGANLLLTAPGYQLLRPYSDDPDVPAPDLAALARVVGPDGVVFSRTYGGRLREEQDLLTANWSRAGAVGARQLLNELLARDRAVYLLDSGLFASRGRWWLGENATPIELDTPGVYFYRVGPPLPGVSIPIRTFEPLDSDSPNRESADSESSDSEPRHRR